MTPGVFLLILGGLALAAVALFLWEWRRARRAEAEFWKAWHELDGANRHDE